MIFIAKGFVTLVLSLRKVRTPAHARIKNGVRSVGFLNRPGKKVIPATFTGRRPSAYADGYLTGTLSAQCGTLMVGGDLGNRLDDRDHVHCCEVIQKNVTAKNLSAIQKPNIQTKGLRTGLTV